MSRVNVALHASWLLAGICGPLLLFVVDGYDLPRPTADPSSLQAMLALAVLVDAFAFVLLVASLGWGYVSALLVLAVFVASCVHANYVGSAPMTSESAVGSLVTVPLLSVATVILAAVEYAPRAAVVVGTPPVP